MGTDLKLLPFHADSGNSFSHTVLSCHRRGTLFQQIVDMEESKGQPVPDNFYSYLSEHPAPCGETGHGITVKTPSGEPLQSLTVRDLLLFADDPEVVDNHMNKAIWAYLAQLPPHNKVALYWT